MQRYDKDVWLQFGIAYVVGALVIMGVVSFLGGFLEPALNAIFYPRGASYETSGGMFISKGKKLANILEVFFVIIGMFVLFFYLKARFMPAQSGQKQFSDDDFKGK